MILGAWLPPCASARSIDSRAFVERAVELIETGSHTLARTYLAPAVIDPRLGAAERARAYYLRGYSYYAQDLPVSASKDFARALEFDPTNGAALVALGGLYHRGEGVAQDAELAFAFFESAVEAGYPEARMLVAYALLEGEGVPQDVPLARAMLGELADEGDATAMFYLARSYRAAFGEEADAGQALEWYQRALDAGFVDAGVALGYMHYTGELGEADLEEAARLFEVAADAGSSVADVALGHMYLVGEGVPEDPGQARALLERAANAGNMSGSLSLGHIFEAGIGVDQDLSTAEGWYRKGAEAGLVQAQLRLFYLLLRRGEEAAAAYWVARAADQDLPQAQNDYAWLLSTSRSEALRDGALALTYAQRAVSQVQSAAYLDTLAAAYAELGRFAEAISTQEQALALLTEAGSAEALALTEHLKAYQAGKAWRE